MFMTAQLEREQALRAHDGQHGQGQCIDAVGLGVAGQKATKVVGLCRTDAVDEVAAADEMDGDGPPRRTGWLHNHLQSSLLRSAFQSRLLQLQQAIQARAGAAPSAWGTRAPGRAPALASH